MKTTKEFTIEPEALPTPEEFAKMVEGYPNAMIAIGYLGGYRCYLNIPLKDAVHRYEIEMDEVIDNHTTIIVVAFHEELRSYEITGL